MVSEHLVAQTRPLCEGDSLGPWPLLAQPAVETGSLERSQGLLWAPTTALHEPCTMSSEAW